MKTYNCIIVGSGIAALQLANELTNKSSVLIVTKSKKQSSNSYRAQGGIAATMGKQDTPSIHFEDTIAAGCNFIMNPQCGNSLNPAPHLSMN